MDHSAQ